MVLPPSAPARSPRSRKQCSGHPLRGTHGWWISPCLGYAQQKPKHQPLAWPCWPSSWKRIRTRAFQSQRPSPPTWPYASPLEKQANAFNMTSVQWLLEHIFNFPSLLSIEGNNNSNNRSEVLKLLRRSTTPSSLQDHDLPSEMKGIRRSSGRCMNEGRALKTHWWHRPVSAEKKSKHCSMQVAGIQTKAPPQLACTCPLTSEKFWKLAWMVPQDAWKVRMGGLGDPGKDQHQGRKK